METSSIVKQVATRGLATATFRLKKYAPEILTTVGVVGVIAAGVLASRATLKLEPVVDKIKADVDLVNEIHPEPEEKRERVKALTQVYTTAAIDLTKLYGPSVTLAAGSVACIFGAHGIMKKRNAIALSALKIANDTFTKYRDRVKEELGEDQERDIFSGIRETEVEDEKTGKPKVVATREANGVSQYAKFFDENNKQWKNFEDVNLLFLRNQERFANERLYAQGFLFLNDVYTALGFEPTTAGQLVGWKLNNDGDDRVDFGLYDISNAKAREFVNGDEKAFLLDFNVDGLIYDKI